MESLKCKVWTMQKILAYEAQKVLQISASEDLAPLDRMDIQAFPNNAIYEFFDDRCYKN